MRWMTYWSLYVYTIFGYFVYTDIDCSTEIKYGQYAVFNVNSL